MRTRFTELLGIRYPIVQASMAWITDAVLAAAVSEAGGLGTIGPNAGCTSVTPDVGETGERLRDQIRKCKELTDKPFAVNFVVGVVGWDRDYSDRCLEVGIEEGVPVAVVSQGSPMVYTPRLKEAGVKVIHVGSTVRHVRKAEDAGVDAVIVSGTEGGGHSGFDQMTTLCLVPQATDAVKIPVIAGGGIVDARGLVAALALGVLLAELFLPVVNRISGKSLDLNYADPGHWGILFAIFLLAGILSGSYPAFYLSSFHPVSVLKKSSHLTGRSGLRKVLVTGQFVVGVILIINTLAVDSQLQYIQNKNLGFEKNNLIYIPIKYNMARNYGIFKRPAGSDS